MILIIRSYILDFKLLYGGIVMKRKYPIIALIGSDDFESEFQKVSKENGSGIKLTFVI